MPVHNSLRVLYLPPAHISGTRRIRSRGMGVLSPMESSIAQTAAAGATLTGLLVGGPLGGAIAALISQFGIMIANIFSGCGQTCVQATQIANQVEPVLNQNMQAYVTAPLPRYASLQAGALNNFDTAWAALTQACNNPQLQAAGQRCISDRQRGACIWRASPGGWQGNTYVGFGPAGSGSACWNWFVGYRDPIANDPNVTPDPAGSAGSILSSVGINPSQTVLGIPLGDLVIPAAVLIVILLL